MYIGKISWARQLYRKIEDLMQILLKQPGLMRSKQAKKVTKKYNKFAQILITFEIIHYKNWVKQVS